MSGQRVLIVDDEPQILRALRATLHGAGYTVDVAATAEEALTAAAAHPPEAVILDLVLPDGNGTDVCRELRSWSQAPVIVLSAVGDERQKIAALDAGADDYVAKPFSTPELLARVRAALRRNARGSDQLPILRLGQVTVDLTKRTAHRPDGALHLTPLEYRVLDCLVRNAGLIVTQAQLINEVWGPKRLGDTRGLRAYIRMLRLKLEPDPRQPKYLITEAGVGYRLQVDEDGGTP